jgi:hypothetical protein
MSLVKQEPVLTVASIAAAIVALLAIFNVVLDTSTVETIVAVVVPLVAAAIARLHVTPTAKLPAAKVAAVPKK